MLAPRPPTWTVIADDVTGACDTGIQFAEEGLTSTVWLDSDSPGKEPSEVPVLSTNTRHDSRDAAQCKVARACRRLIEGGITRIYKKVDSTLQGNIAAEIDAVVRECGAPFALVVPSFPEMGRIVAGGRLRVIGSEAVVDIPALLMGQGARDVITVDPFSLVDVPLAAHGKLVVINAETREHLSHIAHSALTMKPAPVLAGSAALAREVARLLARRHGRTPASEARPQPGGAGPVLLCIGSTNPVTLEQMERLTIACGALISALDRSETQQALLQGRHVIVPVDFSGPAVGPLAELLRRLPVRGLVLCGGDTARMACGALGAGGIKLAREIAPGIPWGTLLGGSFDGMPVATKAGGFGQPDALIRIVDFLSVRQKER